MDIFWNFFLQATFFEYRRVGIVHNVFFLYFCCFRFVWMIDISNRFTTISRTFWWKIQIFIIHFENLSYGICKWYLNLRQKYKVAKLAAFDICEEMFRAVQRPKCRDIFQGHNRGTEKCVNYRFSSPHQYSYENLLFSTHTEIFRKFSLVNISLEELHYYE